MVELTCNDFGTLSIPYLLDLGEKAAARAIGQGEKIHKLVNNGYTLRFERKCLISTAFFVYLDGDRNGRSPSWVCSTPLKWRSLYEHAEPTGRYRPMPKGEDPLFFRDQLV
jgi:hypothetical protein